MSEPKLIPVVTEYPCGPPKDPVEIHPDFRDSWCAYCAKWGDHGSGACPELARDVTQTSNCGTPEELAEEYAKFEFSCGQIAETQKP